LALAAAADALREERGPAARAETFVEPREEVEVGRGRLLADCVDDVRERDRDILGRNEPGCGAFDSLVVRRDERELEMQKLVVSRVGDALLTGETVE
jgi:hypothetical protein